MEHGVVPIERVQLGVRMEKSMVKVLKGLGVYDGLSLGLLLEKIVVHSFDWKPGEDGGICPSPFSSRTRPVIDDLKRIYGMDYDNHAFREFEEASPSASQL
jgi:hypothetical protein